MFNSVVQEERLVELLTKAGLRKSSAKVIVYLSKVQKAKLKEIEISTNLKKSELNLAIKELKKRKWLKERYGKYSKEYKLSVDLKVIIKDLINAKRKELNKLKTNLSKLEKILNI